MWPAILCFDNTNQYSQNKVLIGTSVYAYVLTEVNIQISICERN